MTTQYLLVSSVTMTVMTEPQFPPITSGRIITWSASETPNEPWQLEFENLGVSTPHAQIMSEIKHMTRQLSGFLLPNAKAWNWSDSLNRLLYLPAPTHLGALISSVSEACRLATIILCFLSFKNDCPNPAHDQCSAP